MKIINKLSWIFGYYGNEITYGWLVTTQYTSSLLLSYRYFFCIDRISVERPVTLPTTQPWSQKMLYNK